MDKLTILRGAKALISEPENWTRTAYARNINGDVTTVESQDATCFCSLGAVLRSLHDQNEDNCSLETLDTLLADMAASTGNKNAYPNTAIMGFNDTPVTTHEDIMAMFDLAIEVAEKENQSNE